MEEGQGETVGLGDQEGVTELDVNMNKKKIKLSLINVTPVEKVPFSLLYHRQK